MIKNAIRLAVFLFKMKPVKINLIKIRRTFLGLAIDQKALPVC